MRPVSKKFSALALLNWKHRRFRRIQALASARALCITTYYHVPEYFLDSIPEVWKLIPEQSVAFRRD